MGLVNLMLSVLAFIISVCSAMQSSFSLSSWDLSFGLNGEKEESLNENSSTKVLFVGCGPVGLWTAIQMKLYKPDWDIVVVDKYRTFQRKHHLIINQSSYAGMHSDPTFQKLVKSIPLKPTCNGLQQTLLDYAIDLGIKQEISNVENVLKYANEIHPDAKYVIGADGAHSLTREQIFDDEMTSVRDIQHLIELKYLVKGETSTLDFTSLYKTQKLICHLVTETVHPAITEKEDEIAYDVSLRFLVDETVYQSLSHATFKNPVYLKDLPILDPELTKSIQIGLGARAHVLNEQIVPGTARLTSIKLKRYASASVCKAIGDHTFILVGDAAFGVPFFRSLNNGLLCGSYLAAVLTENVKSKMQKSSSFWSKPQLGPLLHKYENYVDSLSKIESLFADIKGSAVESYRTYAAISGQVPWQIVFWSETEKAQFLNHKFDL